MTHTQSHMTHTVILVTYSTHRTLERVIHHLLHLDTAGESAVSISALTGVHKLLDTPLYVLFA